MNAGNDRGAALIQASANAERANSPRYITFNNGVYWIDKTPPGGPMFSGTYIRVTPDGKVKEMHPLVGTERLVEMFVNGAHVTAWKRDGVSTPNITIPVLLTRRAKIINSRTSFDGLHFEAWIDGELYWISEWSLRLPSDIVKEPTEPE